MDDTIWKLPNHGNPKNVIKFKGHFCWSELNARIELLKIEDQIPPV